MLRWTQKPNSNEGEKNREREVTKEKEKRKEKMITKKKVVRGPFLSKAFVPLFWFVYDLYLKKTLEPHQNYILFPL